MRAVQLPDEIQQAVERQVRAGRASSADAFVAQAVLRLIDDTEAEEADAIAAAKAGIADIEAGRFVTISSSEDNHLLFDHSAARLRENLAALE